MVHGAWPEVVNTRTYAGTRQRRVQLIFRTKKQTKTVVSSGFRFLLAWLCYLAVSRDLTCGGV